ncbi:biotin transporter BioY [Pseudonocardia lacus]|uniref:biotin transporter BioY n=1 Tax=Pseudonocardia lacus TaxID=2835865 RepID=UPI001BDD92E3|nr:biotin transporter BioY [Pseudonocardia lacus]
MTAPRDRSPATALATMVVFAAFIAVLGIFPGIYVAASGVPIVLQNAGPLLAGALLGARRGTAAVALLLALVAIGLPLLSGGRGGLAPFVGPSGGFLIGWLLSALVTGLIAQRATRPTFPLLLLATACGVLADYAVGVPFLAVYTGDATTAVVGSLVFLPGDAAKVVIAALVAAVVHRALPDRLRGTAVGER